MRNIFIIPILLVLISSCTFPWSKNDSSFTGLYRAHIHSSITSLDELGTLLGVNRHESIDGSIRSAVSIPGILSGSFASEYVGLIDGRNSESFFRDIRVFFTSLVSSGSISADEVGVISHGADSYLSYKNLVDAGMMTNDIKTVLKKYENTWLSLTEQANIGMTPEELMGYNMGRNILTKSLIDIEKYATDYPIFHDMADLGMSGSLHYWSVELDRAHILALSKQLTVDLAGTGMTDADATTLTKNLETVSFSGKIAFDPANPRLSVLDGELSVSGALVAQIAMTRREDGGQIRISNPVEKITMELNYSKKDNRYTFDGGVRQADAEMGKITGYIDSTGDKFHELSLEASAQGMTVTLRHTVDGDHFTGKLSAVVGTIEWSGMTGDDQLKSLKINGTAPFGSLTADLTSGTGGMVRGPVVVKSGEETLMNATLALAIAKEKFAIILDVLSEQLPAHFDLDIRAKLTPSNKKVTVPTNTKSFSELTKEIEALTPTDSAFTESGADLGPSLNTGSSSISQ